MEKKWNLQDIKPTSNRVKKRAVESRQPSVEKTVAETSPTEPTKKYRAERRSNSKGRSHLWTAVVIFLVVVGSGFGISALMDGATVTVYPRHREPTVNAAFEAYREAPSGDLRYEVMSLEADGERQVAASGEETVTEQATGEITIYKNTPGTERLIKNTRFESPDGLVFHITESAVVPGATEDEAGETVPGSIKASVFADEAGPKYNLPAGTKFSVPGFKEGGYTELYNSIYATNDVDFTGGYDGPKFTIDAEELKTATDSLHSELREALIARIDGEKPAGFVFFPSSIATTYRSLQSQDAGEGQVLVKEKAILQIPIFKQDEFAAYIAAATIPGYEGKPVRIDNFDDLTFAYTSTTTESTDLNNVDSISFRITGKPSIVWTFDHEQLKSDLLGASRTALNTVLGGYPSIERAGAVVRPFWKRAFPDKLDDITIIESLETDE